VERATKARAEQAVLIAGGKVLTGRGVAIKHTDFANRGNAPGAAYEPFGSIHYAGTDWPVPAQQKIYLSFLYGYLGLGAELDAHSTLYRKRLLPGVGNSSSDGSGDGSVDASVEAAESESAVVPPNAPLRLYTDMCADLFHAGHVSYLRQCSAVADNVHLIVGIHSDETIASYKRAPVCTMDERVQVVEVCSFVDEVLPNAPLRVTEKFMKKHDIDFVVHGTETPELERRAMYDFPIGQGRYTEVPRTAGTGQDRTHTRARTHTHTHTRARAHTRRCPKETDKTTHMNTRRVPHTPHGPQRGVPRAPHDVPVTAHPMEHHGAPRN
jgi:cytidyltransferase-like protein